MASNSNTNNFMDINELVKVYKDPSKQSELYSTFENFYENERFKLNRVVNIYNDIQTTDINNNGRLFFKVTNWNGTSSNKNVKFVFNEGLNFDKSLSNIFDESVETNEPNKIYDIQKKEVGFSFYKLDDIHMYSFNQEGLYIQPLYIPNNIPIVKESEYNFKGTIVKYKAPVVYTLPKIKLGSEESIRLLLETNQLNENFLLNYLYCSNDIENLIKFENLYACVDYHMSQVLRKKYIHSVVKRMILQKKYTTLYDKIINNGKIGFNIQLDLSELFYIFYKHKDGIFFKYLREYFYQNYYELNKDSFEKAIINIDISESKDKLDEYLKTKEKLKNLFDFVYEKNGLVSGSFALKICSNANNWQSQDIDIYIPSEYYTDVCTYLNVNYETHFFSHSHKGLKENCNKKYNMNGISNIIEVPGNTNNGPPIQFIFVDIEPWEFIKNQFDFDICMCGIRKNEFLFNHPNLNKFNEATISDTYIRKMVGDQKDNYSVYRAAKTVERSIKYMKRGFTILNLDHFLHEIEMHMV